ncbi:ABC transporter permease [Rhodococcus wratislaviensis]|uniref:Putative ABC transporter permease protein n=1 Tax=Rhodococcus wratislaviensis NBRC 100605 TaxID=1219028 RepID=X0PW92_RHOWR|nr:ABC transporter permease [Rhodococcus wratislaviensis]GAF47614.1 putative ABC transporter permease protein [Rhodococcus wratislaviensis NBRC 100605]
MSVVTSTKSEIVNGSEGISTVMARSVSRARSRTRRTRFAVTATQIAVLVVFLGAWQWGASSGKLANSDLFWGSPSGILQMLVDNYSHLFGSLVATFSAALVGFVISVVVAVAFGIVLSQVSFINRVLDPYIIALTGMPRIALAPLFVLWFGIGDMAKIALCISLVFFIVLINVLAGFKGVNEDLVLMARSFGAGRGQIIAKITVPAAVPVLFAGLRLGLVFSILAVIASEMTAARDGLGLDVVQYAQTLRPNGIFAILVILATVMALLNWLLGVVERKLLRWAPDQRG